jgi:uncharacterized membrane protein YqjE
MTEAGQTPPPEEPGPGPEPAPPPEPEQETGPARALTLHLLHMLETRMDAASIALNTEIQSFSTRIQLRLVAAGALFIAIWGGIVLLAIALPEPYRIPVLSIVVAAFALGAAWAQFAAKRKVSSDDVGSMRWFLEGLKLDFEVLSRSLANKQRAEQPARRSEPDDLAA